MSPLARAAGFKGGTLGASRSTPCSHFQLGLAGATLAAPGDNVDTIVMIVPAERLVLMRRSLDGLPLAKPSSTSPASPPT
jgi:hypothetical protein